MYELLPLCLRNGIKNKIKSIQLNLREAVWLCDSEECIWPFTHKNFEIFSRDVGKSWCYDWNIYQPVKPRFRNSLSQDLSMYTPPDTPRTDISSTETTILDNCISAPVVQQFENTDHDYTYTTTFNRTADNVGTQECQNITGNETAGFTISAIDQTSHIPNDNCVLISDNISEDFSWDQNKETFECNGVPIVANNVVIITTDKVDELKVKSKNVPQIRSIQKAHLINTIKNPNIKRGYDSDKQGEKLNCKPFFQKLQNNDAVQTNDVKPSEVQDPKEIIKTVYIDGLPPITVKYEESQLKNASISNKTSCKRKSAKKYEKFSFDKIKAVRKKHKISHDIIDLVEDEEKDKVIETKAFMKEDKFLKTEDKPCLKAEPVFENNYFNCSNQNIVDLTSTNPQNKYQIDDATNICLEAMISEMQNKQCQQLGQDFDFDWLDSFVI